MRRRSNLLLGIVAVGIAVLLLLRALGLIPDGLFDLIVRGWPGLLVLAGLALLLGRRLPLGSLMALIISGGLVIGLAATAFTQRAAEQRTDYQQRIEQPLADDLTLLRVQVATLATDVEFLRTLNPAAGVTGEFIGSLENSITVDYTVAAADNSATLTLRETQTGGFPMLETVGRGTLRVELPAQIPLDVAFSGADGAVILNMSGLPLERLNVEMANGAVIVTLPDYDPAFSQPTETLGELTTRNGDLTLFVPASVSARLELERGGSGIDPLYDAGIYNYLVGDILEARDITVAETVVRYRLVVPRGRIRVEVPGSS
ncbi:MAG: hypothetical protein GYB67_01190 [Chloroflexi bacterium]|nr:hypothetical protein [Chloroflexota bacterium]